MTLISDLRNTLEQQKGQKFQLEKSIEEKKKFIRLNQRELKRTEEAREIMREAGLKTQKQLQFHISDITSLALAVVFNDPYELKVEFVQRRNKTECDLSFSRNGNQMDPLDSSGGGTVDVAALALRFASWSMENPKSNNVIILDEPFPHLRGEKENERAFQMVKEISTKLNIQIIMIGDVKVSRDSIEEFADKIFDVTIDKKGISKINES